MKHGGVLVEENANLVIRLLIRRPECLGPALRGEGEGLKSAIISGNHMSEQIQFQIASGQMTELGYMHPVPLGEEDEDFKVQKPKKRYKKSKPKPGGKCNKCNEEIATLDNFTEHLKTCNPEQLNDLPKNPKKEPRAQSIVC